MRAAALACRSYYSLLRCGVCIERLVRSAREYGYGAIALTDTNALYGLVDFAQTCRKYQIQPIFGAEILTSRERAILLIENPTGYSNLCQILTAVHLDPQFSLVGRLRDYSGGLICICPDRYSAQRFTDAVEKDNLFTAGVDLACMDFNILDEQDAETMTLLNRIRRMGAAPGIEDGLGAIPLIPQSEFLQRYPPRSVRNNLHVAERCCFDPLDTPCHLPRASLPDGRDAETELARICHRNLARLYGKLDHNLIRRLEHELAVIRQNRFSDYFLVVRTIVDFARSRDIPVDVRGSAAGSLVSHVLGFTRICPIENRLYFERFMNGGRKDCPDIDVDLCWRRRDEVIRFCYDNWGDDHVAMICTINRYRRRGAIRDAARAAAVPPNEIGPLVRGRQDGHEQVFAWSRRLLGLPRHISVHCGGIVITPQPVWELAPLERAAKGVVVTQYDKDAAEVMGLIKIDLLGNRSLSTVHDTVRSLPAPSVDIDHIDRSDPATAAMLSRGDSFGVFQCESPGMRQLLRGLKVRNQNDVAVALSLIRPGPASGGMKAAYIDRHVHKKPFAYLHPRLREIFADTYGVMLYQEDVMRLAVEVAGYTVAEADRFRSEVSKKVSGVRLHEQYKDFVYARADRVGIDRATAEKIWEEILRFAAYSYCKAHAAVYANIAWHTAWLKAHFPREFYCAVFNNHQGMYPMRVYVWDAIRHGLRVLPPHVNASLAEWTLENRSIRAGLNIIRGLSRATIDRIVQQRTCRRFADLDDLRRRIRCARPEIENLVRVGACDELGPGRPAMLAQLECTPCEPRQGLLFDPHPIQAPTDTRDYSRIERVKAEVEITGIPFCMHPETLLQHRGLPARQLEQYRNRLVTVAGFIAAARRAQTADGRQMGFVTLEDSSGLSEISFFPDRIDLYRRICSLAGPVWVSGKVTEHLCTLNIEGHDAGNAA